MGEPQICLAEVYHSIGLKNDILFYVEAHWPKSIYEESSYFSIVSTSGYYNYSVSTNPGSIDHNEKNKNIYESFYDIIVPLEEVLKEEETKPSYTTEELRNTMNDMNLGSYNFEENEQPAFTFSR